MTSTRRKDTQTIQFTAQEINALIVDGIQEKKGQKIVLLDLRELDEASAEYYIICEGTSHTQVKAIADSVLFTVKQEAKQMPSFVEGKSHANWILLDYFNTIVHIFYPETRAFYQLEALWGDAQQTHFEDV